MLRSTEYTHSPNAYIAVSHSGSLDGHVWQMHIQYSNAVLQIFFAEYTVQYAKKDSGARYATEKQQVCRMNQI
jgi:riboflavin synthase alpha subunit